MATDLTKSQLTLKFRLGTFLKGYVLKGYVLKGYALKGYVLNVYVWRWSVRALTIGLFLYVAWLSSITFPIEPRSGTVMQDSANSHELQSDTITIGTYNIHSTKGLDGKRSIDRIARVLSDASADFVALNEVRSGLFGVSNQANELGTMLGLSWLFLPTEEKLFSGQFGLAFLSRYRINRYWVTPLISAHHSEAGVDSSHHRNLISVELTLQGQSVMLLFTHIDRGELRLQQLDQVLTEFEKYPLAILMGDLNSDLNTPPLKRILKVEGVSDVIGGAEPHEPHIDWILTRGFTAIETGGHPVGPSDHPYYWVQIKLTDSN